MRRFGLTLVAVVIFSSPSLNAEGAEPAEGLAWDSVLKECPVKPGEMQVATFFAVTNVSASDVVITQVVTSCGCTVASLPSQPWRLAPGSDGKINATMNLAGRSGTVAKTLTVVSSVGNKVLTIQANVPPPPPPDPETVKRQHNREVAKADRLAVFRNNCAQCHLEPAFGKMGKALYADVCGVCHEAKSRAAMVPDLRKVNQNNGPQFWRAFIQHGKAGSMMPPFDQNEGGPLNERQIDSLVAYLTGDFRTETKSVGPGPPSPPVPPNAVLTPATSGTAAPN